MTAILSGRHEALSGGGIVDKIVRMPVAASIATTGSPSSLTWSTFTGPSRSAYGPPQGKSAGMG